MGFVFFFFVIIFAVIMVVAVQQSKRTREVWASVAQEFGFTFTGSGFFQRPSIRGTSHGLGVLVTTFRRSSGKNSTTYTRFRITYPQPLPLGIRLSREGFFSGVAKMFGAQDIQIGDAGFDGEVLIKGADPRAVARFLTPTRRARIRRLLNLHHEAVIDREGIACDRRGVERNSVRLANTIRLFLRVAWSLAADRSEDEPFAKAVAAQNAGRIQDALKILKARTERRGETATETPPPPEAAPVEERLLEAELLRLGGKDDEAKAIYRETLEETPDDPEAREWVEHLEETPAPEGESAGALPLDVKSVCEALFDPKHSSLDATRAFEKTYQGARIAWQGKLQSIETSAYDFVFGSGETAKATFEVFRVPATLFGEREVLAVVRLPRETAAQLEGRIGSTFAFEGKLLKADGFVRNLYVTDGRLVGPVEG
ncbi:MAG: hypothetical protein JXP34_00665 [Planctomycetes bacterium]|nr:hypothetical protein [Planctomycetota bacterium]